MREGDTNKTGIFGTIVGALYIMFGILQILTATGLDLGISSILLIPEDLIGGFVLIIIGLVFVQGAFRSRRSRNESMSFILVASILGAFFMIVYTLIMIADVLEARVLVNDDWENWKLIDSIRPGIYLGVLSILGYVISRNHLSKSRENERECRR